MSYLPDTYGLTIPAGLMREIIAEFKFCDDISYIPEDANPYQDTFRFNYMDSIVTLDYNWQYSQLIVNRNTCSANHMVNPAKLITDRVNEFAKLKKFIEGEVYNQYMEHNGIEVLGIAKKDKDLFLVYNTKIEDNEPSLRYQLTLSPITHRKHKKQLLAMFELTKATLIDVAEGWQWRSRNLAKQNISGVNYDWLSYERLIAETCDPNITRHTVRVIWYLDTLTYDETVNYVIKDLNDLLNDLITFYS